jgi:multidrug efflux system membrane fusion protein
MNPNTPTGLEPDTGIRPSRPKDPTTPAPPRRSRRGWLWLVLLAAIGLAAYFYWPRNNGAQAGNTPAPGGKAGKKGGRGQGGPPPVVAVRATRGSIGVYVNGLGNVTPIYTVTVRSRVDGQLMEIHYKEGDLVQKGQPLVELDPRPFQVQLEQAEGQQARDQALLNNARVDVARYETLLKQNAIPEQQVSTQRALVAQYEGTVKADQGQIDTAKLNIVYCHIAAPITGRIGLRLVDPGNIVRASDPNGLLVITQMEPISVIFPISEKDLPAVRRRFRAGQNLQVAAWDPDNRFRLAGGRLATIDNQIDQTTGTIKLRAEFDNKDNALYPNQFVNVRLLVEQRQGVVLLPSAAVQRTTEMTYVWLLKPDNSVTVRKITEGVVEGDNSEITSGLDAGDAVVMTGVDKLNEGSRVIPQFQGEGGGRGGRGGRGGGAGRGGEQTEMSQPAGVTQPIAPVELGRGPGANKRGAGSDGQGPGGGPASGGPGGERRGGGRTGGGKGSQ